MSDSSTASTAATGLDAPAYRYQLSDDLAKLCLPQEWKDSNRTLAWVNSICALFLAVGLVGLKAPKVVVKPVSEVVDVVPVIFTPPEEPPPPDLTVKPEEMLDQNTSEPTEAPQVVTVVAAADPNSVAFAVPVPGAVAVAAQAQMATPPPRVPLPPSKPTQFNPAAAGGEGTFPGPDYPGMALRNRYQGTVIIEIKVEADGTITSASVFKSSGFSILDEAALRVVQLRWRFSPGGASRWLHWPCQFKLQ